MLTLYLSVLKSAKLVSVSFLESVMSVFNPLSFLAVFVNISTLSALTVIFGMT